MTRNDVYEQRITRAIEQGRSPLTIADECHYYAAQTIDGSDADQIQFERAMDFIANFLPVPVVNALRRLKMATRPNAMPEFDGDVPNPQISALGQGVEQLIGALNGAVLALAVADTNAEYDAAQAQLRQALVNLHAEYTGISPEYRDDVAAQAAADVIETAVRMNQPVTAAMQSAFAEVKMMQGFTAEEALLAAYLCELNARRDAARATVQIAEKNLDEVTRALWEMRDAVGELRRERLATAGQ